MSLNLSPLNFPKWLKENGAKLQPPVNNFCLYKGQDYIVMVVGGPNERSDYHMNETEEWFFQQKGPMLLKVVDPTTNRFHDIHIGEGEMYLLPPNTPHNPVRFSDTIGLVVERQRPDQAIDRLRWYCPADAHADDERAGKGRPVIFEKAFHCVDLGTQLKPIIQAWQADEAMRTCKECGQVAKP